MTNEKLLEGMVAKRLEDKGILDFFNPKREMEAIIEMEADINNRDIEELTLDVLYQHTVDLVEELEELV